MSANNGRSTPDTEASTPTLTERVRDLAVGRRSLPSLRGTNSGSSRSSASLSLTPTNRPNASHGQTMESEQTYRERCLVDLHDSRPLKERIKAIKAIKSEIKLHSAGTLMSILANVEDLTTESAPIEARKAVFDLLISSVGHSELDSRSCFKLFTIITTPYPAPDSSPQILALRQLVRDGRQIESFAGSLIAYLNDRIPSIFDHTTKARASLKKQRFRRLTEPFGEEVGLEHILSLAADVVYITPASFEDDQLVLLVSNVLQIAQRTTAGLDLQAAVEVIKNITQFSQIPLSTMELCLEVLCAGSSMVEGTVTWTCISNILRSKDQNRALNIILNILSTAADRRAESRTRIVRGALSTIAKVVSYDGKEDLPLVPVQSLANALRAASLDPKHESACLETVVMILNNSEFLNRLIKEDWGFLRHILDQFTRTRTVDASADVPTLPYSVTSASPLYDFIISIPASTNKISGSVAENLQDITSCLSSRWDSFDPKQRQFLVNLFLNIGLHIDIPDLGLVVDYMMSEQLISPSDENWAPHLSVLVDVLLLDIEKTDMIRCRVLYAMKEVHELIRETRGDSMYDRDILLHILQSLKNDGKPILANALADFLTDLARDADDEIFDAILTRLVPLLEIKDTPSVIQQNQTASCLIRLFLQILPYSASHTVRTYNVLVDATSNRAISTGIRLSIMKLLTRLRCDENLAVRVVPLPDSQGLADTLYRTEASSFPQSTIIRASNDDPHVSRAGRTSTIDQSNSDRSRSTTRSGNATDRSAKTTPPLWMYPGAKALPLEPPVNVSQHVYVNDLSSRPGTMALDLSLWLDAMLDTIENESDWELYSYVLVHLPSQLSNLRLFTGAGPRLANLEDLMLSFLSRGNFHEPPASTGVKKGDVALCMFQSLVMLIGYREHFGRARMDKTVHTFLEGISKWDRATKCCLHGLAVCCYEIPNSIATYLPHIIGKMSKIITQSYLAVDILEFLGGLARLPDACRNIADDNLRAIFGICISYIDHSREQRQRNVVVSGARANITSPRYSGNSGELRPASEAGRTAEVDKDLPEYVFALAYHVMTHWFLSIDIRKRSKHVGWIARRLTWKDEFGNETMGEQSQVTLDMMHRTAYLDLGETKSQLKFSDEDGPVLKQTWLVGMSIVTIETATVSGLTQVTKRQASGTTHARYQQCTASLPPHHIPVRSLGLSTETILPSHVLLQLGSTIAPMPIPIQPIVLPDDDSTKRAISSFDRNDTVDGYKVGVVFVSKGQTSETEILANESGTESYDRFISGLGTRVSLKDAIFNTQGLDRESNQDGTHTYAWRDRVTEIVFHIPTMMPTDVENDPRCTNKKRHIGNEFVKIIYNDSGLPFDFDTFESQFNYVNIVITPEALGPPQELSMDEAGPDYLKHRTAEVFTKNSNSKQFYKVQTQCASSLPRISPAATPKIISASTLPAFVRQVALSASVFSQAWSNRDGGEHVSSWRNRLKEIIKLRNRYGNTATSQTGAYPGMSTEDRGGARSYAEGDPWKGTLALGGMAEEEKLVLSLDFTRWT